MLTVMQAASYIYNRYKREYNEIIDEMKLHKLLYFTQREAIIQTGQPLFEAQFEAGAYGPVLLQIRDCYRRKAFSYHINGDEMNRYRRIFDYIFNNYANMSSWSLSMLSHGEISWQRALPKSGEGVSDSRSHMKTEDIREDAERIKTRRFYFNEILPQINAYN